MRRLRAVFRWDLLLGLHNRFVQIFALACLLGGLGIVALAAGQQMLPLALMQALLFFGSLISALIGWGSGQRARAQAGFLFAQPLSPLDITVGKLGGTGVWCILLLLLFLLPAAVAGGMPGNVALLAMLSVGFLLVYVLAGLLIGMIAAPVSGLLAVLLAWGVSVAGWELGLLLLSDAAWLQQSPGVFVALLLINPAGAFRISTLIGLDSVPFDAAEVESGRVIFENIVPFTMGIFALWLAVLTAAAVWRVRRMEF